MKIKPLSFSTLLNNITALLDAMERMECGVLDCYITSKEALELKSYAAEMINIMYLPPIERCPRKEKYISYARIGNLKIWRQLDD